uniref:Cytochrome c oxidase assembly protein COX20, mitochondrial n=1 Tax=Mola mola TaxID=94237 RepID=A0A3Q3WKT8_MOLML
FSAFRLLGILDVQNTPCARDAILHGAGGSLAAGLLHFLATSRVRRSFDVGFAGFMLTTLGSWFYCRMNNAKLRVQQRIIQDGIRNKVAYEGTVLDPTNRPPAESIRALVTSGTETPPKSPPPLTSSPQDGRT